MRKSFLYQLFFIFSVIWISRSFSRRSLPPSPAGSSWCFLWPEMMMTWLVLLLLDVTTLWLLLSLPRSSQEGVFACQAEPHRKLLLGLMGNLGSLRGHPSLLLLFSESFLHLAQFLMRLLSLSLFRTQDRPPAVVLSRESQALLCLCCKSACFHFILQLSFCCSGSLWAFRSVMLVFLSCDFRSSLCISSFSGIHLLCLIFLWVIEWNSPPLLLDFQSDLNHALLLFEY